MKIVRWNELDESARSDVLSRAALTSHADQTERVSRIIDQVRADGDGALKALTRRFDGVEIEAVRLTADEIDAGADRVAPAVVEAIERARETLTVWHEATMPASFERETAPGVRCGRVVRPIGSVGLYVPAGSAPLPSTVLMLGVPALIAGCPQVVLCSPPNEEGDVDPTVLAAARALGIDTVCRVGGAQAIAAMAFGTDSVPRCDKLFGPGNSWVTRAKQLVAQARDGAAIDMPAGPSEVLVIADENADPEFVAIDLLSQAEHGPDSQAILVTPSGVVAEAVAEAVERLLTQLPRAEVTRIALQHSSLIVVDDLNAAVAVSNRYAPEHLILQADDPDGLVDSIAAAGSIFVGRWAPEALGDYCSGTNHVLPTDGWARACSGVSVDSFTKKISVQRVSADGLRELGPVAATLAAAESLDAHRLAVTLRLAALTAAEASA